MWHVFVLVVCLYSTNSLRGGKTAMAKKVSTQVPHSTITTSFIPPNTATAHITPVTLHFPPTNKGHTQKSKS